MTSLDVDRVADDVDVDRPLLNGSPKRIKKVSSATALNSSHLISLQYAPKERSYRKLDVTVLFVNYRLLLLWLV